MTARYDLALSWRDGREETVRASDDETVLEAAESADVSLPFGCRTGACVSCAGRLVEGAVEHFEEPLDLESGEARPLFDYDVPLHSPVWSPEGQHLAYLSPMASGIEVHDLVTGELVQFANEWGAVPVWSPDGTQIAFTSWRYGDKDIFGLDLESGEISAGDRSHGAYPMSGVALEIYRAGGLFQYAATL